MRRIHRRIGCGVADGEKRLRCFGIFSEIRERPFVRRAKHGEFRGSRRAGQHESKTVRESRIACVSSFAHHTLSEESSGLDIGRIIHQVERLQRRVRARSSERAALPKGRAECEQRRVRHRSLPIRVEASAVQVVSLTGDVSIGAAPCRELLVNPLRMIWLHRRSTDFLNQQAAHCQRLIANELAQQPEAWPARQQPVVRVAFAQRRREPRVLLIGRAHHQ